MDILIGILVAAAAVIVIAFVVARKAVTRGVDPTQLTFDPSVMVDVQALARAGKKVQAIALLRQATPDLSLIAATAMVEKLAISDVRRSVPGADPVGPGGRLGPARGDTADTADTADLPTDIPLTALPADWSDDAPSASAVPFEVELEVRSMKAQGREQDAVDLLCSDAGFDAGEAREFVRGL